MLDEKTSYARTARLDGNPGVSSKDAITTLEDSRIRIGDAIQLQGAADSQRHYVRLIGYFRNRGLIVSAPESDGELVMVREGQSFIARFFSGQHAYGFPTNVTKQTSMPFPHVHLAYPREVQGLEVRKGSRIHTSLITAISGERGGVAIAASGKIIDLSIGGAGLCSKAPLGTTGDRISVKFKVDVHGIDSYLVFDCIIRTFDYDRSDLAMPYFYGVQFICADNVMTLALAAYVYKQLIDDTRS